MAIPVATGNIPYYGIYNNKAVCLNGMNSSLNSYAEKSHAFRYIFPWNITVGNSTYYAVFEDWHLRMYMVNPDTEYIFSEYFVVNSSGEVEWRIERVLGAVQPNFEFNLLHPLPRLGGESANCQCYVYEHTEFVFIHFDYVNEGSLEIVITKNGYIQYNATGDCEARSYSHYSKADYFSSLSDGCNSCSYNGICSYFNTTNTSCGYSTTYTLSQDYSSSLLNYSKFLLIPPSSGGVYILSTTQHLDLSNYLTESNGEISTVIEGNLYRVPLLTTKNNDVSNLSVCSRGATKYVAFSEDNSSDTFSRYTPVRLHIDGSIKSPYLPRIKGNKKHILSELYDRTQSPDNTYYTHKRGSYYRYYTNAFLYTLPERINVSQIRLFGHLRTVGSDRLSDFELPNSRYTGTLMMINTGTTDLVGDWTPDNTNQSIIFEAGYLGSGGKFGQQISVVKGNLNMYIKQFTFTPSCSATGSSYAGAWAAFDPSIIEFTEYSTGNTYYYTL